MDLLKILKQRTEYVSDFINIDGEISFSNAWIKDFQPR